MSLKRYRKEESEESDLEDEVKDYVPYVSVKDRKKQLLTKHKIIVNTKVDSDKDNESENDVNEKSHFKNKERAPISLLDQHHELKEQAEQTKETDVEKQIKEEQNVKL